MKMSWNRTSRDVPRRLGLGAILVALAGGGLPGCTREFYREWANQDVSEAVFEKSRDPRWRLDLFPLNSRCCRGTPTRTTRISRRHPPMTRPPRPSRRCRNGRTTGCSCRLREPATRTCSNTGRRDAAAKAAAAGRPSPDRRARVLGTGGQRPPPGDRPAPAGHARPAARIAGWPGRAT